MKIYDCFMFFDEEMLLDLRLNMLNKFVDKFVITEANFMHNGEPKKLVFDINQFAEFKDKIIYITVNEPPPNLLKIQSNDSQETKNSKNHSNAYKRHIYQLEKIKSGIKEADPDDIIIISDLDEIPNLNNINFEKIKNKLIFFKQKMFYYKFNLYHENLPWFGSKACKKKNFKSAEWIQWIKSKKYPWWRLDTLFSNKKYSDIKFIENGGWHFTNIKSPEDIEKKLKNFVHYKDFESSGLSLNDLKNLILQKKVMYNHSVDKKSDKWSDGEKLKTLSLNEMPEHIINNYKKYKPWLDNI